MSRKNAELIALDNYTANKVRQSRIERGVTIEYLADCLDVTYQQLGKYEKGTNRISSGRLYLISKTLGKDLDYFFPSKRVPEIREHTQDRLAMEVNRNFYMIRCPKKRQLIADLTRAMID